MEPLAPIPTPPAQRWREFRIQALPVLTFIAVIACVVVLWQNYIIPTNVVAHVEVVQSHVMSSVPGKLVAMNVQQFQRVTKGQVIGAIVATNPETTAAEISAAHADLKVQKTQMVIAQQRSSQDYAGLLMNLLEHQTDLATDRINLALAETNFVRAQLEIGTEPATISQLVYDTAKAARDALAATVAEKEKLVETMEKLVEDYRRSNTSTEHEKTIEDAIAAHATVLNLMGEPVMLRAPMDGVITAISNRVGEVVMPGAPIAVIVADNSEHIVGYLRPPFDAKPLIGDRVQVRRVGVQRKMDYGTVLQVSPRVQPLDVTLASPGATQVEFGLAFLVTLPKTLDLIPGEPVDLIFEPRAKSDR
jgi:multidrug resistance efflux pump